MDLNVCDFREAVKSWDWNLIDKFLGGGGDINTSLVSSGPQAGYTALHFAAMEEQKQDQIEILMMELRPNVNSMAADGVQPLHLAYFRRYFSNVEMLWDFGADVDTALSKEVYEKYKCNDNLKWSDNFGSTMTLITFAFINNDWESAFRLMKIKANVVIKDINNKTFLMYAIENSDSDFTSELFKYLEDNLNFINTRNNDGLHVVHYLLPNENFGEFRYNGSEEFNDMQWEYAEDLFYAGADVNAMVDNDPDTLLINKAAYRCLPSTLNLLFDLNVPVSNEAKPLHYFMLPVDSEKYVRVSNHNDYNVMEYIEKRRNECLEHILRNLVVRRVLGMFVAKDEVELMDHLVAKDPKINKIVSSLEKDFVDNYLKKSKVYYDGNFNMTLYDIAVKVFNHKCLKLLVRDEEQACLRFAANGAGDSRYKLRETMNREITRAYERRKLLEKVEKILELRKFIPLPYEIILIIIEYLDNYSLDKFVKAFYQYSIQ